MIAVASTIGDSRVFVGERNGTSRNMTLEARDAGATHASNRCNLPNFIVIF